MLLVRIRFAEHFWWKINADAPRLFPLAQNAQWSLVNPVLYAQLWPSENKPGFFRIDGDDWLGTSREVALLTNDAQAIRDSSSEGWGEAMWQLGSDLVVRFRHLSGQATLPKPESLHTIERQTIEELPAFDALRRARKSNCVLLSLANCGHD
jgi:hypothetical protein